MSLEHRGKIVDSSVTFARSTAVSINLLPVGPARKTSVPQDLPPQAGAGPGRDEAQSRWFAPPARSHEAPIRGFRQHRENEVVEMGHSFILAALDLESSRQQLGDSCQGDLGSRSLSEGDAVSALKTSPTPLSFTAKIGHVSCNCNQLSHHTGGVHRDHSHNNFWSH